MRNELLTRALVLGIRHGWTSRSPNFTLEPGDEVVILVKGALGSPNRVWVWLHARGGVADQAILTNSMGIQTNLPIAWEAISASLTRGELP